MLVRYSLACDGRPRIAHGETARVVTSDGPRELRWGVLPPWRGHGGKREPLIYVADEARIAATPMLRQARGKQRCGVVADGYYTRAGKHDVWMAAGRAVHLAGVWAENPDDGVASFALVVCGDGDAIAAVDLDAWLARGERIADARVTFQPRRPGTVLGGPQGELF